jgi:hypothetical protein
MQSCVAAVPYCAVALLSVDPASNYDIDDDGDDYDNNDDEDEDDSDDDIDDETISGYDEKD